MKFMIELKNKFKINDDFQNMKICESYYNDLISKINISKNLSLSNSTIQSNQNELNLNVFFLLKFKRI